MPITPHNILVCLLAGAGLVATPSRASTEAQANQPTPSCEMAFDPASPLRTRVGQPSTFILKEYAESGAQNVTAHVATEAEWTAIDAAIAALPRLHREILMRHLRRISFVDTAPGAGNALTSPAEKACGDNLFDFTFRAGLFKETMTTFLNDKEMTLFSPDGSGASVHLEAGTMSVLPYILLHEGTHIVDFVLGLSADANKPLRKTIWGEKRALQAPYDANAVNNNLWRDGKKLPLAAAADLYRGLSKTPFVTVYASASPNEDLAETVAWQQISSRYGVKLRIDVKNKDGKSIYRYKPLTSPLVRRRFAHVDALLKQPVPDEK